MNIIKQSTGNVVLTDAAGNIQKVFVNVNSLDVKSTDEVIVKYGFNQWHSIFASQVSNTQIEPALAVAFSGNAFDLVALLSSSFFFELSGGGSQDLASVLAIGNISGPANIVFDSAEGLTFSNNSFLREGTIDAGTGSAKGISEICGLGYESKWEGGVRYIMGSSGNTIRQSLYNFANVPTVNDDNTKGYAIGSLWTLDNGTVYVCSDASTVAAVWALQSNAVANTRTISTTSPLIGGGDLTANRTISIPVATTLVNGYLSSTDWTTFNNKQPALGFTPATSEGWSVIVKSANQDVTNSTVLVDDTDLQFSVVSGGQYMIELDAVISSNSTANDYKNAFAVSAGTMKGSGILTSNSAGTIGQASNILASAAAATNTSGIGTALADLDLLHSIKIIYSFTASANATFKYQFAQNGAGVGTTARTLKGSILKYKKIN